MVALLQRVRTACVWVGGCKISSIGAGLLVFLGVEVDDTQHQVRRLSGRVVGIRIFNDSAGRMNQSISEVGGEVLVVSQFTLCADTSRGRRPAYTRAAPAASAHPLYTMFADVLSERLERPVSRGVFGENMLVQIENDGPATFFLTS